MRHLSASLTAATTHGAAHVYPEVRRISIITSTLISTICYRKRSSTDV